MLLEYAIFLKLEKKNACYPEKRKQLVSLMLELNCQLVKFYLAVQNDRNGKTLVSLFQRFRWLTGHHHLILRFDKKLYSKNIVPFYSIFSYSVN